MLRIRRVCAESAEKYGDFPLRGERQIDEDARNAAVSLRSRVTIQHPN